MPLPFQIFILSFGRLVALFWLGINGRGVFFVQIQLDVEGVQPVGFLFQLLLKCKGSSVFFQTDYAR